MRPRHIGRALTGLLGLLVLLQFNNCGGFQNVSNLSDDLASLSCPTRLCIVPSTSDLSVKVNLPSGTSDQRIQANLAEFNIGGECNEGGYAHNIVRWELRYGNNVVRTSDMFGMIANKPQLTANSQCINGRFLLYVNLAYIGADQLNRSGLFINTSGSRGNYQLYVEIIGLDSPYDTNTSRRSALKALVNLVPI